MTVKELIKILKQLPKDLTVTITDGYNCSCYSGEYNIKIFEDYDGGKVVDIGIGGTKIKSDETRFKIQN